MTTTAPKPACPAGFHPLAFAAYVKAGLPVSRLGHMMDTPDHEVAASAGTHDRDGSYEGHPYSACTDLHILDLDDAECFAFCTKLAAAGFCPFYRKPGANHWPASDARHIHMVYPACQMKAAVRQQVEDWCHAPMRNGLASHANYAGWHPTPAQQKAALAAMESHNK
jgi:hypothetical protein